MCGRAVFVALVVLFLPLAAEAATGEVTPFLGLQQGGALLVGNEEGDLEADPAFGVMFTLDRGRGRKLDIVLSHQDTTADADDFFEPVSVDVAIDYLQIGGRYMFRPDERVNPYVAITVGGTHIRFDGGDSALRLSGAAGAGVDLGLTDRLALRLDGRFYTTLLDSDGELSCDSSGECVGFSESSALRQFTAAAGLVIRF
jgi:opacity protein-like surface antigen